MPGTFRSLGARTADMAELARQAHLNTGALKGTNNAAIEALRNAVCQDSDIGLNQSKIVEMAAGWRQNAEYWKQLPAVSTARFLGAVFCLFASFSFIFGTVSFGQVNLTSNICFALVNGLAATFWAVTGTRRMFKTMGVVACLQAVANIWITSVFSKGRGIPALQFATFERYAFFNAVAAVVLIIAGYSLFIYLFSTEGGRYYGTLTEMRLAGGIHRSLVPEINTVADPFEFYGCSWPSGEVSGDLVDVVQHDRGWFAYVADVSGHGVPAGVLMTMVKSAARTRLAAVGPVGFLSALNQVLLPRSAPNMYVTFAFLSYTRPNMELATAGHMPILHFDRLAGTVSERWVSNFLGSCPLDRMSMGRNTLSSHLHANPFDRRERLHRLPFNE